MSAVTETTVAASEATAAAPAAVTASPAKKAAGPKGPTPDELLAAFRKRIEDRIAAGQRPAEHKATSAEGKAEAKAVSSDRRQKGGDRHRREEGEHRQRSRSPGGRRRLPDRALEDTRSGGNGGDRRGRDRREPAKAREPPKPRNRSKRIKVTGFPEDLEYRYLKELFETEGAKITAGHIEDGTGILMFEKADHAWKAKEDFDGGELAGKSIKVELLPKE